MAIDWDADVLAPAMSSDVFGEAVQPLYRPAAGAAFPIDAVFDQPFRGLVMGADGEPDIATSQPQVGVRLSQFLVADPLKGDKLDITVKGQVVSFMVADVQADGKGFALLKLLLAA